jgi:5-hydroxyisourate hydrolase
MKRVSTHILDIVLGKPASGVPVRFEIRNAPGEWRLLTSAHTDHDGRCAQLIPDGAELIAGIYRLSFDTAGYHAAQQRSALYPIVEVTFQVREGESSFHIPLLLSPNGYTTYRGS